MEQAKDLLMRPGSDIAQIALRLGYGEQSAFTTAFRKAAGMSPLLMLRRIVLPSAFRRAIPAYGNEVIFMLHGSAVASVVTIIDLTGAARLVQSRYYAPFEAFITAGLFYLAITFGLIWLFRGLEHRLHAHLRRPVA